MKMVFFGMIVAYFFKISRPNSPIKFFKLSDKRLRFNDLQIVVRKKKLTTIDGNRHSRLRTVSDSDCADFRTGSDSDRANVRTVDGNRRVLRHCQHWAYPRAAKTADRLRPETASRPPRRGDLYPTRVRIQRRTNALLQIRPLEEHRPLRTRLRRHPLHQPRQISDVVLISCFAACRYVVRRRLLRRGP